MFIPCHRTIGLSATPDREDGTFDIIKYHLGEVFVSKYAAGTMDAEVNVMLVNFDLWKGREKWLKWEGQFQYSRYYQILKNSKIFMGLIKIVLNSLIDQNRHIVLMGERIKLFEKLADEYKDYDCVIFKSGVKNDCLTQKIVFTTPGKMRDGVDASWKDTLIMTSPISNVNQATGRIVRSYKDKQKPLVIDFVDTGIPEISNSFRRKRLPFYNKKNWNIKYYAFENNILTEMGRDKAFRLSGLK
jgi:superfamily II DNA or RNA helicase